MDLGGEGVLISDCISKPEDMEGVDSFGSQQVA